MHKRPAYILPLIVLSQFAGTSLWFTGNAILPELKQSLHLSQYAISSVTSAVMLGFVAGTLVFAFLSLADRVSPARLFFMSCVAGAIFNVGVAWFVNDSTSLIIFRFLTGFFIAGIYPVGMKIAADWYERGLGKALGFLLGALVIGTAFPHLLKDRNFELPWKWVLIDTSFCALVAGIIMYWFVGDGPFRKKSGRFQWNAFKEVFASRKWRQAAYGYFGHMWELYTFWGFLPLIIGIYAERHALTLDVPLFSFLIIATGGVGCIAGGLLSQKIGSAKVATAALLISGICCFLSPFFYTLPQWAFLSLLFLWGFTVCPDSPQFSTLVAQYAPDHLRGTALTLYNCIGFLITSVSLFVFDYLFHAGGILGGKNAFLLLGLGALFGLPFMIRHLRSGHGINAG